LEGICVRKTGLTSGGLRLTSAWLVTIRTTTARCAMFKDTIPNDPTARQRESGDPPSDAPRLSRERVGVLLALATLLATLWVAAS
jgi:hypothetical protein